MYRPYERHRAKPQKGEVSDPFPDRDKSLGIDMCISEDLTIKENNHHESKLEY